MEIKEIREKLAKCERECQEEDVKAYVLLSDLESELGVFLQSLKERNRKLMEKLYREYTERESEVERAANDLRNQLVGVDNDICELDDVTYVSDKLIVSCKYPDKVKIKKFDNFVVEVREV